MTKLQLLIPLDGTEFSRRIEPQVRKLFPAENWALRLLHVSRVPLDPGAAAYQPAAVGADYRLYMYGYELPGAGLHPMYDEEHLEEFRQSLERDLQDEVKLFESQGYEVSAAVHFGEPANAIVSYAEEHGVDLVAMVTHHRKGLERLLHGSVARRALNHLSMPALLLRADDDDGNSEATAGPDERAARGRATDRDATDGAPHAGARTPSDTTDGSTHVHKDDQIVTPAETAPATLSGMTGRGVLTIIFGESGKSLDTQGSWFPDDPEADLTPLREAARHRRSVIFEGRSVDAETAGHDDDTGEQVRREVRVTSVRDYRDYGGHTRNLVSFELVGEPDQTDVPAQYTRAEFADLPLAEIVDITGEEPPRDMTQAEESKFRDKAWESYKLDIEHRDEWGTARQDTALPHGE
ncbi:MAG: universal stress protein [Trueperaceae bacterium]